MLGGMAISITGDPTAQLRAAGLTPTKQRRIILVVLGDQARPPGALEVHAVLRRDGYRIGLTTVYRTLHALAAAGLVHVLIRDGEQTYRRCQLAPHWHLVCECCGRVSERDVGCDNDVVAQWFDRLGAEDDFVPDPRPADLRGRCGACRRAASCRQRRCWPGTPATATAPHIPAGDGI